MSILCDAQIESLCRVQGTPMIFPFYSSQVRKRTARDGLSDRVVSYGLSSYGYDAMLADEFKIFTNVDAAVVDPKAFSPAGFVDRRPGPDGSVIIPPNSFLLGRTVEYFRMPRDLLALCVGKSTYARCGLIVNVTPLQPEWEGHVTIEISNSTPLPAKVYANEGICQFLFLRGEFGCLKSYADLAGLYQGQTGVCPPKV